MSQITISDLIVDPIDLEKQTHSKVIPWLIDKWMTTGYVNFLVFSQISSFAISSKLLKGKIS